MVFTPRTRDLQTEQMKHFGLTNPISPKPIISNDKYYCSQNWGHEGGWEISLGFGWFFSDVLAFWFVTLKPIKFIMLSLQ